MFIELTDHLRCPADHEEAFLILLPETMDGRRVQDGALGCPACHREFPVAAGIVDFGGGLAASEPCTLPAEAAYALLGLDGPGGYLALLGAAGGLADDLSGRLPGIHLVLVNPPADSDLPSGGSILRAPRLPLQQRSMRGAVIPGELSRDPGWLEGAIACVLPGLRVVGEGPAPERPDVTIMAQAGGWWVGRRR
jgi:uncharacterized protein YbaR (Trm112 family)